MSEIRLLDANEAADFLGCSVSSIRIWTRRGILDCVRFGRLVRYTEEHLLNPRDPSKATVTTNADAAEIRRILKEAAA